MIFIVLEAALDLNLSKDKLPLIIRSASVALIALIGSSAAIATFLGYSMNMPWFEGWVYAIPLSIMSSAIIIPSVSSLSAKSREFMVYESTFSDIFGIMAFYLLLGNLLITLVLAIVVSYLLVYVLQKITSPVKLFLSIAVLLLIYAIQKLLHLSPLVLILIFGLMLNNHHLFFPKWNLFRPKAAGRTWPESLLDDERMHDLHRDYHMLTLESAFVIRTFFFVIFGMTVSLATLTNLHVITEGLVICCLLFAVRFICLLILQRRAVFPLLYIAPRGLITILLFFQIQSTYPQFLQPAFDQGILLVIILITSIIMTIALVQNGITLRGVTVLPEIIPDGRESVPLDSHEVPDLNPADAPPESDESNNLPPT